MMKFFSIIKKYPYTFIAFVCVGLIFGAHYFETYHTAGGKETMERQKIAKHAFKKNLEMREEKVKQRLHEDVGPYALIGLSVLVLVGLGIVVDGMACARMVNRRPVFDRLTDEAMVPWGVFDALRILVWTLFLEIAIYLARSFLMAPRGGEAAAPSGFEMVVATIVRDACALFLVWKLVLKPYGSGWRDLGLGAHRFWQGVRQGVLAYVGLVPPFLVMMLLLAWVIRSTNMEPDSQEVMQMILGSGSGLFMFLLTTLIVLAGPIFEEILFRGLIYSAFRKKIGVVGGLVVSSALFSLAHMNAVLFVPIFLLGLYLGLVYHKTGSLAASCTVHMLHNLAMTGFAFSFKGLSS